MSARVIPLADWRSLPPRTVSRADPGPWVDLRQRPLRDLRISLTDRCNFRCPYCMPRAVFGPDHRYLPHDALLSFEEIVRLARIFVAHGVTKIRLTGGEPLLRKDIEALIGQLAGLRTPDGREIDLTLTTNGSLLARKAAALKAAGLGRVTVSLDALDDAVFRRMNDVDFPVASVLEGIAAARAAGLGPIKVNTVVKRGVNDGEILPLAHYFRGSAIALRFIEYMDVGSSNGWRLDEVLPSQELLRRIERHFPLVALAPDSAAETAQRWGYADAAGRHDPALGEIGLIASVTQAFCGDCSRARLSIDGRLYLCLFAERGHDLRALLRGGADDDEIAAAIASVWRAREDRYSELRASLPERPARRVEMSHVGG